MQVSEQPQVLSVMHFKAFVFVSYWSATLLRGNFPYLAFSGLSDWLAPSVTKCT